MSFMLPSTPPTARSVVGVAGDVLGALRGSDGALPGVRSAVLVVVDGVGALQLRAHAGHARHLTAGMTKKDVAYSVFPTTTTAALTSILTGAAPGEHGLVGYRVRDPESGDLVNQLSGWNSSGIDPTAWQPHPTVFEQAVAAGHPTFALGVAAYANSGFTRATLRGGQFVGVRSAADRVEAAYDLATRHPEALVYCYLPEADKAGHRHGVASGEWIAALEDIDSALSIPVPSGVGVLVTADHGMIDVPAHRHVLIDHGDLRLDGVRHIAGEPRMLHVYLEPDADPHAALTRWRERSQTEGDVLSRAEAIGRGLFGSTVTHDAAARIGDLLVIARGNRAFYDATAADQKARGMVGQHGALTPEEQQVPYLRLGAFRR